MIRRVPTRSTAAHRRRARRSPFTVLAVLAAAAIAVAALSAAPALAQEFVKVDDAARENIPAVPFVAAAYGFIWIAILAYVAGVARRIARVRGELAELRRRLGPDGASGNRG